MNMMLMRQMEEINRGMEREEEGKEAPSKASG
jgi:hypothetical protein